MQNYKNTKTMSRDQKISYYASKSNEICMCHGNGKTGKKCLTLSLPVEPTCNHDAPCYKNKVCYCLKGCQAFSNVLGAYYRNLRLWIKNPKAYEDAVVNTMTKSKLDLLRINDAGDLPSEAYLQTLVNVANRLPDVKILIYTKKYDLVNKYLDKHNGFPNNLTMRFSYADKNWKVPNPHNLPVAYIDFEDKSLNPDIPKNAFICKGNANPKDQKHTCSTCRVCWNKKVNAVAFKQH